MTYRDFGRCPAFPDNKYVPSTHDFQVVEVKTRYRGRNSTLMMDDLTEPYEVATIVCKNCFGSAHVETTTLKEMVGV
jgi:hypothetical protein